ncbi:MAG: ABC transporter permease [Peptococcaceae bacterium]|nr:ABC transporter permease [Peptococcaceae bacterium]
MRYFSVFMHKEMVELWRTSKALIVAIVFLALSIMSVLLAIFTPVIMQSVFEMTPGMSGETQTWPEATAVDSYAQFFSNIGQMGLLMIIIMFGAGLVREKRQGTAALLTARGLPRWVVALGKLTTGVGVWTVAYLLAFGVCLACTVFYFPDDPVDHMVLSVTGMWLYGIMLLCVGFVLSTIFKSSGGPVGIPIALLFLLPILDFWKTTAKFSPNWLFTNSVTLLGGTVAPRDALAPFLVTLAICLLSVCLGVFLFKENEL